MHTSHQARILSVLSFFMCLLFGSEHAFAGWWSKRDLIIIGGEEGCPPKLILKMGGKHEEDLLLMPTCHRYKSNHDIYAPKVVKHLHYTAPDHGSYGGPKFKIIKHHHHHHGSPEAKYYDDEPDVEEEVSPMEVYDADTEIVDDNSQLEREKKSMSKLTSDH